MNSYRIFKVKKFPSLSDGEVINSVVNLTLPGFTENAITKIRGVSKNYFGYEYFEIDHEMFIKDSGLAFGFLDGAPVRVEFEGYKKLFIVKAFLKREENYLFLSYASFVVKDLYKKLKDNEFLKTEVIGYKLDLNKAQEIISDYTGVWFKGVSSRVSSSALYGSDLANEPLFQQLRDDGANLSSIIIPFKGIPIQVSDNAGISSHHSFISIEKELNIIEEVKNELIEKLIANV